MLNFPYNLECIWILMFVRIRKGRALAAKLRPVQVPSMAVEGIIGCGQEGRRKCRMSG